jgi:GT2 family glycosyltransferase
MNPKDVKLFIATPMFGGMCYHHYAIGLMDLGMAARHFGMKLQIKVISNDPFLVNARNKLVHEFMKTDFTHFLFIDADVGFTPDEAFSMIEQDLDIIAGTYPMKQINWKLVHQAVQEGVTPEHLESFTTFHTFKPVNTGITEIPLDQPFEVAHAATGFMLIKRRVFEELADKVPEYEYRNPSEHGTKVRAYFDTPVIDGMLYSEDVSFCNTARKHGIKVHIAPWVSLPHSGTYTFKGRLV